MIIHHDGRDYVVTDKPVPMTQSGPIYAVNIDQARGMINKLNRYMAKPDLSKADRKHYKAQLALHEQLVASYEGDE